MRRRLPLRALLAVSVAAAVLIPAQQALAFTDVPSSYWDYTQITYVTPWMSDYGTKYFNPTTQETRSYACRTMVEIWAPTVSTDPSITFPDLPKSDPMWPYANVCVKLGWFNTYSDGTWRGDASPAKKTFDQAVTLAMGMQQAITGLQNVHEDNGTKPYSMSGPWPYMQVATYLQLHYDHTDDVSDLQADTKMTRDEVAYSIWAAKTAASWEISNANTLFSNVSLPTLNTSNSSQNKQFQMTSYALAQVGYPYIWGGEWNAKSPSGYCCGYQAEGGFDCSGFSWWVLKKNEDGYNAAQFHPSYAGWSLHQRSSSDMAANTPTHLTMSQLQIGDLMFFASDGGHTSSDVDHVGIFIGNNWMMHSTSGGPQLETVASGWYHDHFVWGRHLSTSSRSVRRASALDAGEAPVGP
jgi:cell wall-associated NlpC family hydrolase